MSIAAGVVEEPSRAAATPRSACTTPWGTNAKANAPTNNTTINAANPRASPRERQPARRGASSATKNPSTTTRPRRGLQRQQDSTDSQIVHASAPTNTAANHHAPDARPRPSCTPDTTRPRPPTPTPQQPPPTANK